MPNLATAFKEDTKLVDSEFFFLSDLSKSHTHHIVELKN